MKKIILLWGAIAICAFSFAQTEVFINEIHYDNDGSDTNEGVEIAGPAGTDLSGWIIELYNGSGGSLYKTENLTGIIPNVENNRGLIWFPIAIIQNDIEAIALIEPNSNVVQFLSYEGLFTATEGIANGLTSIDILVSEDGTDVAGNSLQLSGSGTNYEDFTWATPNTATNGLVNNGQSFTTEPAILTSYSLAGLNYEYNIGPSSEGSFIVEGSNLTNDIILTSPANFEISTTSGTGWAPSITLLKGAGTTIGPTTIFARLKSGLNMGSFTGNVVVTSIDAISKTVVLNGNVTPNIGSIIITEIMANPTEVTDNAGEYFEVYNTTSSEIDMNGWIISDAGGSTHTINLPINIPSEGYAIFGINSDNGSNGGVTVNYEYVSTFTLANSDDEIILTTPAELGSVIIDEVNYNSANFPTNAGESMELHLNKYNHLLNDIGENWGTATSAYGLGDLGTPGTNNDFGLSVVKNQIEDFELYPNPVLNGKLFMTSRNNTIKRVDIYAINGQKVYNKNIQTGEVLNVSNLQKGIYLVKIEEEGKIATRKLMVY